MSKKIRTEQVEEFFKAILTLDNVEECFSFFEDVCTTNEILSIAQRYQVATLLMNNFTYQEIADQSGASTATISRVKRSIDDGTGGYAMVMDRITKE
ncbi:MAG: TrpR YerC/YecD [Parasporobacterium sp.]|nr:TrpR YerC/YecD [Parasporobacterium sp.]